jgi:hypothetical protein
VLIHRRWHPITAPSRFRPNAPAIRAERTPHQRNVGGARAWSRAQALPPRRIRRWHGGDPKTRVASQRPSGPAALQAENDCREWQARHAKPCRRGKMLSEQSGREQDRDCRFDQCRRDPRGRAPAELHAVEVADVGQRGGDGTEIDENQHKLQRRCCL